MGGHVAPKLETVRVVGEQSVERVVRVLQWVFDPRQSTHCPTQSVASQKAFEDCPLETLQM